MDYMRGHGYLVGSSQPADQKGFTEPVGAADVRHEVAGCAALDQLAELEACLVVLARRNGNSDRACDLGAGRDVVGQHRLLEPEKVQIVKLLCLANRAEDVKPLVGVHHELHPVAQRLPDRLDPLAIGPRIGVVDLHLVVPASHRRIALRLGDEVGRGIFRPAAAAIGWNPIGHGTPELVQR